MAVMVCLCCAGHAQEDWTARYGGNGADNLQHMIAVEDGLLLAGWTSSTDGDLSMRKRTGETGWLLRLDAEGGVMWSCCTAHVGRARMSALCAHEDGTFSCMLWGEGRGEEWLRVSDAGRVTSRIELPKAQESCPHDQAKSCFGLPVQMGEEAALAIVIDHEDGTRCCALMRENGEVIPGQAVFACEDSGVLKPMSDGSGRLVCAEATKEGNARVMWITPGSGKAPDAAEVPVDSGKLQMILSILPQRDGSVIFSGQLYAIGSVVMRVSEQGEILFVVDDCDNLDPIALTSWGFAGADADEIQFYDEDGTLVGSRPHHNESWLSAMAPLGDGVAIVEQMEDGGRKNVRVTACTQYLPVRDDLFDDALFTRPVSQLVHAQADGEGVLLVVQDLGEQVSCVRIDAYGRVLEEEALIPAIPARGEFRLPAGTLRWEGSERGAQVTLIDGQGKELWQTHTPIHTAADGLDWLCAAQTPEGNILLGGRYTSVILPNTEEKQWRYEMTQDGIVQEGVVMQLSADGVLMSVKTIEDIGAVYAIAPGKTDAQTLLMGSRGDMTNSIVSNVVSLDHGSWEVLDVMLQPENVFLITLKDGTVLAAGTNERNGRSTVVVERASDIEGSRSPGH